jgi:hypothetical protein
MNRPEESASLSIPPIRFHVSEGYAPYLQFKSKALSTEPIFFPADRGNGWIFRGMTLSPRDHRISVYHLPPSQK